MTLLWSVVTVLIVAGAALIWAGNRHESRGHLADVGIAILTGGALSLALAPVTKHLDDQAAKRDEADQAASTKAAIRLENLRFVRLGAAERWKTLPFAHLDLFGLELAGLNLPGADFYNANLRNAKLMGSQLTCRGGLPKNLVAPMFGQNFNCVQFVEADLREASLNTAYLTGAALTRADAREARFVNTHMTNSLLYGADLREADFRGAQLNFSDSRLAKLGDANFDYADLRGAYLLDADLTGASFEATCWDDTTAWPGGFTPPPMTECPPSDDPSWFNGSRAYPPSEDK